MNINTPETKASPVYGFPSFYPIKNTQYYILDDATIFRVCSDIRLMTSNPCRLRGIVDQTI